MLPVETIFQERFMPVYEYECKKCAKRFEVVRSFHEKGSGKCPTCGLEGQRIYTAPPLLFKGSGFYVTDHRKKSGPEEGSTPSTESATSSKGRGDSGGKKAGKPKPKLKVDIDEP